MSRNITITREIAVCKQNNTIDKRMERKQNKTRETAECQGNRTIQERQQNVTEHNNTRERDSRMPRKQNNTTKTIQGTFCLGTERSVCKIHVAAVTMISRIPAHPH
jgi:hypothetical protein